MLSVRCRFSSSATFLDACDLVFHNVSHDYPGLVYLTDRFISYEVRYGVTL